MKNPSSTLPWVPGEIRLEEGTFTVDGFDKAILGVSIDSRVVYNLDKVIAILMARDGMSIDAATGFFEYNIAGSYLGEHTPIFMTRNNQ